MTLSMREVLCFLMFSQTFEQMKYMINDIYAFKMNDGKQTLFENHIGRN